MEWYSVELRYGRSARLYGVSSRSERERDMIGLTSMTIVNGAADMPRHSFHVDSCHSLALLTSCVIPLP